MSGDVQKIYAHAGLHRRLYSTFGLLLVYRIGCNVPIPGLDPTAIVEFMHSTIQGATLGRFNTFTGNSLERMTVFALGIMPCLTVSAIMQMLPPIWPHLRELSEQGERGRRTLALYARYGTLFTSLVQSAAVAVWLESVTIPSGATLVISPGWVFRITTIMTLTLGSLSVMWISEQITRRGVGNGLSVIIFAGILVGVPRIVLDMIDNVRTGTLSVLAVALLGTLMVALVAFIVWMETAARRVPMEPRRVPGARITAGNRILFPLRLNTAGVVPVVFAASLVTIPSSIGGMSQNPWLQKVAAMLAMGQPLHYLLYVAAIIFFCYFYTSIVANPIDTVEKWQGYGVFIVGLRPSQSARYIDWILTRLTLVGAIYLATIAVVPEFLLNGVQVDGLPFVGVALDANLPDWVTRGMGIDFYFGGTALVIVVVTVTDFVRQIADQLVMRSYEGAMKSGRSRVSPRPASR